LHKKKAVKEMRNISALSLRDAIVSLLKEITTFYPCGIKVPACDALILPVTSAFNVW
jgi:hypothetical protein